LKKTELKVWGKNLIDIRLLSDVSSPTFAPSWLTSFSCPPTEIQLKAIKDISSTGTIKKLKTAKRN